MSPDLPFGPRHCRGALDCCAATADGWRTTSPRTQDTWRTGRPWCTSWGVSGWGTDLSLAVCAAPGTAIRRSGDAAPASVGSAMPCFAVTGAPRIPFETLDPRRHRRVGPSRDRGEPALLAHQSRPSFARHELSGGEESLQEALPRWNPEGGSGNRWHFGGRGSWTGSGGRGSSRSRNRCCSGGLTGNVESVSDDPRPEHAADNEDPDGHHESGPSTRPAGSAPGRIPKKDGGPD